MSKAFVLSSGGLDSTTCLAMAIEKYGAENVVTASLYYGQKHDKELKCA
ncbi:MAG: 7-cyano-7-deazaguanine synthase [Acholeplasmatales bacterium]|nr:7-cyano-7-deazaguanine synthase [Methanobrevibacter sp.]MBP5445457.1 7-cyano-7-deazaguanine synthase [Acholeplasmatales bacterium]